MISDVDNDMFFISQKLVTQDLLNYRLGKHGLYMAGDKFFKDEALVIAQTLKNFLNEITYSKLEESNKKSVGSKDLKHISEMIKTYFKSNESQETYFKQMALSDHNVVGLLFFILKL